MQTFAERHSHPPRDEAMPTPSGGTPARGGRPTLARIEGELKREQQAAEEKAQDGAPKRHLRLVR
jgi:hypothetical protein